MDLLLEQLRRAPSILDVVVLTDELSRAAQARPSADPAPLLAATRDLADAPTAIAALHALARLTAPEADARLGEVLAEPGWLRTHAAWAMAVRRPAPHRVASLVELIATGRLAGMLAQRAVLRWATTHPEIVAGALLDRLAVTVDGPARGRLVETLGRATPATDALPAIASDRSDALEARLAAVAALGDRAAGDDDVLDRLAARDDELAPTARLALLDRRLAPTGARSAPGSADGVRLLQVHLGGRLDRGLSHAGRGGTGGIATLLIQLGEALAAHPAIASVTTVGRGSPIDTLTALSTERDAHAVVPVPFGDHEASPFTSGWPALIAAERGLRRVLRSQHPTLLHLRMTDAGSLAAARLARRRRLPVVFTLAPDPHAVIDELQRRGELDRASFGPADEANAYWFRAWTVRMLGELARQVVVFPRPDIAARLRDLVGIDVRADQARYHVVPEGIDLGPVRRARAEIGQPTEDRPAVLADLDRAITALGPDRRGLPVIVSVGRLSEIKGMSRLVAAFAADARLRERANLVVVGGDLHAPSPEERVELDRIEAALAAEPAARGSVVLLGHRRHDDVLRVLAAAEAGLGPAIGSGGAYVCASRKEEFGLAIVEALAIGLPVVAPLEGGPPSYVEAGVTGLLVDTTDLGALAEGVHAALDLAPVPGRADAARRLVARRFTIGAMRDALVPVYRSVVPTGGEPAETGVAA